MSKFKNIHLGETSVVVSNLPSQKKVSAITIPINSEETPEENKIIPWGSDNLYPQNFYNNRYIKNGAAVGGLTALKAAHYGTGIQIVKQVLNENTGDIELKKELLSSYPDIRTFFKNNKINKFFYSKITDLSMFQIAFTEHVLSMNKNEIVRVKSHKAAHCRFAPQDKSGVIPYVVINTDWKNYDPKYSVKIPFIDKDVMTGEEIKAYCKEKEFYSFMTVTVYPFVDENYYPKTDWHAVDRSGWMEVANSIPELKKYIYENQMHVKFMVYVSDYYFESFYKEEWDEFDSDKRQKMREELSKSIDDYLSGNKNAGKSIVSPIFEENGKFVEGIKVIAIDDKLKDSAHLPDASASNTEILFAIGVDPVIIGVLNAGTGAGRSGSDKREAYTILGANLTPRRHYTVDDFELWQEYNGWDIDLMAIFPSVNLTTLDKNPSGQVEVMN